MSLTQWIKLIIKITTILPVVLEGVKAIVKRYKELNTDDSSDMLP